MWFFCDSSPTMTENCTCPFFFPNPRDIILFRHSFFNGSSKHMVSEFWRFGDCACSSTPNNAVKWFWGRVGVTDETICGVHPVREGKRSDLKMLIHSRKNGSSGAVSTRVLKPYSADRYRHVRLKVDAAGRSRTPSLDYSSFIFSCRICCEISSAIGSHRQSPVKNAALYTRGCHFFLSSVWFPSYYPYNIGHHTVSSHQGHQLSPLQQAVDVPLVMTVFYQLLKPSKFLPSIDTPSNFLSSLFILSPNNWKITEYIPDIFKQCLLCFNLTQRKALCAGYASEK